MAIPNTTPIRIRHVGRPGAPLDLGTGEIDRRGIITVTAPVPGQAEYLAETMAELNARADVIVKGPPLPQAEPPEAPAGARDPKEQLGVEPPEEARPGPSKTKVRRGASGFLAALKHYGLRVYGLEFAFDEQAFDLDALLSLGDDLPPL